jgi:site-specific DNA recombinase
MPRRKRSAAAAARRPLSAGAAIYVYARDSGGARQEASVGDQLADLRAHAAAQGWVILAEFNDAARSGTATAHRDAFLAMIERCHEHPPPVQAVLVWHPARFGRDELDRQYFRSDLRRRGIELLSLTEAVPEGPFATIIESVLDLKDRLFVDDMSRQVRRGLRALVAAGYAPGGTPPTGYVAERVQRGTHRDGTPRMAARWLPDPEVAPRVSEAFRLLAAGRTYQEIAAICRLPLHSKASYWSMFRNRTYLGILKLGEEEFPDALPALVDPATWAACQAQMGDRRAAAAKARRTVSDYLLSGLLYCSQCGSPLIGQTDHRNEARGGHGWRNYRCNGVLPDGSHCPARRVGADRIERAVVNLVLDQVLTPATMRELLAELRRRLTADDLAGRLARLVTARKRLATQIARLLDSLEQGGGPQVQARLTQRQGELAALTAEHAALARRQQITQLEITEEDLQAVLLAIRSQLQAEDIPAARAALASFVARVVVNTERGEAAATNFELQFHPPAAVLQVYGEVPPRGYRLLTCLSAPY